MRLSVDRESPYVLTPHQMKPIRSNIQSPYALTSDAPKLEPLMRNWRRGPSSGAGWSIPDQKLISPMAGVVGSQVINPTRFRR